MYKYEVEEKVKYRCEICKDTGEVIVDVWDEDSHLYHPTGTGSCPYCIGEDDADFSGSSDEDR